MNQSMLLSDALVRALGWALAHSLWQATAAALMVLWVAPRLKSAPQRYWLAYSALLAVCVAAVVTAWWMYTPADVVGATPDGVFMGNSHLFWATTSLTETSVWLHCTQWLDANHALLVAGWLLGFGVLVLRLVGGFWQVHRLRTRGVTPLDADWQGRFNQLKARLSLAQTIQLFESVHVQTPVAFGWFKPVVLLPVALVNQLSIAETEAVLAHELAHIARRDWVFNLLQAFIESLFYYHPAVWWISAVVRRERENCCDDAALAATGNPLAFAKALVQVQEMAKPVPALALGLNGRQRRPLLDRVRRILNQPQQRQHQVMEKITATILLLAFLAIVGWRANATPALEAVFAEISNLPYSFFAHEPESLAAIDSLPKPKSVRKYTREDGEKRVEAEYHDGILARLNVNGREISAAEFPEHEALIAELAEEGAPEAPEAPEAPFPPSFPSFGNPAMPPMPPMPPVPRSSIRIFPENDSEGNTVIRLNNYGDDTEVVVKGKDVFVNGKKVDAGEEIVLDGTDASRIYINDDGSEYTYSYTEVAKEMELVEKEMAVQEMLYEQEQKRWEKEQKLWEKEQKQWEKEQKAWEKEQKKWEKEQKVWEARNRELEVMLKKELLNDGLISSNKPFSIKLDSKEMWLNNVKQSEEIRKKYSALIEKKGGIKLGGSNSFFFNFEH